MEITPSQFHLEALADHFISQIKEEGMFQMARTIILEGFKALHEQGKLQLTEIQMTQTIEEGN